MPRFSNPITGSTVWLENDETRIVWITLLALADDNGEIWASVPELADFARVTVAHTEAALSKFLQPDPYEGRRIEWIPGGWKVLDYQKYDSESVVN